MEATTSVLLERGREPAGLNRMFSASLLVHVGLVATIVAIPKSWRDGGVAVPPTVMTISLGGAPGPQTGGMNQLGGRPIQEAVPLPAVRRPEPFRPPAAKAPQMTLPEPKAKVLPKQAKPPIKAAPQEARGTTPTKGAEVRPGDTVADTGGRGIGFGGLSSAGGGGTGGYLEVSNFCCPDYLTTMLQLIRQNWDPRQPTPGQALVKFTIQRDGTIKVVELERTSGYVALDMAATRALGQTRRFPALPAAFDQPELTVHLRFEYSR
ncbi:MAG: TonB family protein [Acidobacteria bacterium]|nr:TonB family protein [Acidobacteriota bacterium]